jgi:hypothetical protein
MGVSSQHHALAALNPRERTPRYTLDRRLGGSQSWSGHRSKRKNNLNLPGIEPQESGLYLVTILTELLNCSYKNISLSVVYRKQFAVM